jgi:alkylhydroperoxidase family enzyme
MARISFSHVGRSPFQNLLGHHPTILECWNALENAFFSSTTFSGEFKEEVRRTLAYLNGCEYCMAKGSPSEHIQDVRTLAAVNFAKRFCHDHRGISDQDIEELKRHFTEPEIAELCALLSFFCASQKFGASLALTPSCPL